MRTTIGLLNGLGRRHERLLRSRDAMARREAAAELLIEAGALAQGILDDAMQRRGCDAWTALEHTCARLTTAAARLAGDPDGHAQPHAAFRRALAALGQRNLPRAVQVRLPEGFAFYALYPELFAEASRRWRGSRASPVFVIGIRSIGVTLGAVVAVAA